MSTEQANQDSDEKNKNPFIPHDTSEEKEFLKEQILIEGKPLYYIEYGKEVGTKTNCQPDALPNAFDKIYKHLLESSGLDATSLSKRIIRLESEKTRRESEIAVNKKIITENNDIIEANKKEIESIKEEIKEIKSDGVASKGSKWVITVATILASCFLFVLYFYYSYFVFGGKAPDGSRISEFGDIFQVPVFSILWSNKAIFSALIYLGLPGIFFGLAYGIHFYFSKKKWGIFAFIIIATFLLDLGIAHKLAKMIHKDELVSAYSQGGINITQEQSNTAESRQQEINELEAWNFYSDSNFWTFMSLGFLAFVLWGFIFTVYTSVTDPRIKIEELKSTIKNIENKIINLNADNKRIDEVIKALLKDIDVISRDIEALKSGVIPIDYPKLHSLLGLFMQGWIQFAVFRWDKDEETQRTKILAGKNEQQHWLNIKKGNIKRTI